MPYKNETVLSQAIKDLFKSWGKDAKSVKIVASMGQEAGIPDRLNIYKARVVFCEAKVKSPFVIAGRPTAHQLSFMRKWQEAGGEACCVRCIEDVIALFTDPQAYIHNYEVVYRHKTTAYLKHGYFKKVEDYIKYWDMFFAAEKMPEIE
jgi:hypothetical protein